jgi:RND family efflux transporter MFP subunit
MNRSLSTSERQESGLATTWLYLFSLFCAVALTSCVEDGQERERPDYDSIEILPEVVFKAVDDQPLDFFIESRGVVEPLERVQIVPRLAGFIDYHSIEDGRYVNRGDTLIQLNRAEWEFQVKEAYNQYLNAKAEYDVEVKLRRGEMTESEIEGFRITTGLADAEVAYERAKLDLSFTTITAPFSGIISTKEVISKGSYIQAGTEFGILIDYSTVRIRFEVLESEISQLKTGYPINIIDPAGNKIKGRIVAVSPEIDVRTKTGQVIAEAANPGLLLKPGMTVEGRVFVKSEKAKVRVPREAILERDGRSLVFKLHTNEVEWIYVNPVSMNTEWAILDHPDINPGDTLAIDKHFSISHQQKVIPIMAVPD